MFKFAKRAAEYKKVEQLLADAFGRGVYSDVEVQACLFSSYYTWACGGDFYRSEYDAATKEYALYRNDEKYDPNADASTVKQLRESARTGSSGVAGEAGEVWADVTLPTGVREVAHALKVGANRLLEEDLTVEQQHAAERIVTDVQNVSTLYKRLLNYEPSTADEGLLNSLALLDTELRELTVQVGERLADQFASYTNYISSRNSPE